MKGRKGRDGKGQGKAEGKGQGKAEGKGREGCILMRGGIKRYKCGRY